MGRPPARNRLAGLGAAITSALLWGATAASAETADIAIVGATVIDGTGGQPLADAVIRIDDGRILDVAPRASLGAEPVDAETIIDAAGGAVIPGLIDNNVHATVYGNAKRRETVVRYGLRNQELALESAQLHLKRGVTTIRDSYGVLPDLVAVRDRVERGEVVGARMLVAGNIVGWGGPFSITFSLIPEDQLTYFQETWNDRLTQGVGEDLLDMGPEALRTAINTYLDKGPDFIKYGGSAHFRRPVLIGFSPRAQKVLVEETHKRGKKIETHATSQEALRLAVEAGVDFIQHPEILSADYPPDLLALIAREGVVCGLRPNMLTGRIWREHVAARHAALERQKSLPPPSTSAEANRRAAERGDDLELQRRNALALIRAGCRITIATDNYQGDAPELRREPKPIEQEAGIGSLLAVEGLVELGLTPMEAIVAATRNGAHAAGLEDTLGLIAPGMAADLVILNADPLADITNIRRIKTVIARGRVVDIEALPQTRLFAPPDR